MSAEETKATVSKEANESDTGKSSKKRERTSFQDPVESSAPVSTPSSIIDISKGHFSNVLQSNGTPSSSPPTKKVVSIEGFAEANNAAQNLVLCHEIALDDKFKLEDPKTSSEDTPQTVEEKIQAAVKDAFHRAFWDNLSEDLNADPPVLKHAFILLTEIKEIFLSLLPTQQVTSLHKRINEGLDIDLLKQQATHNALDIHSLTGFLVDTMGMMCAPVRDDDVKQLRSLENIVDSFKGIYKMLGLMQRDFVNFTISSHRPLIQQHHVEYERKKFAEIMEKLPNGLESTEKWIGNCYDEMKEEREFQINQATARGGSSSKLPAKPSPLTVLKRAYLKLLHWEDGKPFPETVLVDQSRLIELQIELKRIVLLSSALLTTFSSLSPDLASQQALVTSLKQDLLDLLKADSIAQSKLPSTLDGIAEQILHRVSNHLQTVNSPVDISEERRQAFKEQICTLKGLETNSVYKILLKRIHEYFYATAEYFSRARPGATDANTLATPPGLQAVSTELLSIASAYAKLVNRNQLVYGPFYVPVLRSALDLPSTPSLSPMASPREKTSSDSPSAAGSHVRRKLDLNANQADSASSSTSALAKQEDK